MNNHAFGDLIEHDPRRQFVPTDKLNLAEWLADCLDGVMNGDPRWPENWLHIERLGRIGQGHGKRIVRPEPEEWR